MIELYYLLGAIVAGVLYRMGGVGRPYNTKMRDFGVPLVIVAGIAMAGWSWWLLLVALASFGTMTTYWKSGADCEFAHWVCTCFFYTLPFACFFYFTGTTHKEVLHCVIGSTLCSAIWSEYVSTDWLEEFGRGFILALFVFHIV